ncbi:N-lysine methyltransferase KMT5A isoform X2 [Sceloporus undulatus]|uniref:N-lysine methyltransferase KMT5A isoform X2 n=1 Tax=Sceloporus undulatus TaxID=8520 RepID=UPI001C4BD3C4|nr:N-lysine methyltransferase KMT5A isoform X2 [Sceloporus undulatus]
MGKGRRKPRMAQAKEGRAQAEEEDEAEEEEEAGAHKRGSKLRINGENIFSCQSKIYTFLSPNKPPATRPPLQEENSATHHEAKCQGKMTNEVYRKGNDRLNIGNGADGVVKSKGQRDKERSPESPASSSDQKAETEETHPLMPPKSADAVNEKQSQKKSIKAKPGPRRKAQGKTQQNRKVTDYYPVRRSSRKSKKELQIEEKKKIDELIESGKEDGMKIDFIDGKGRGVIATKQFHRGDFVVEYHGDLIEITDAKKREAAYAQDPSTGCYMYYFQYLSKTYCVDATKETSRLGRLINHSKCGNCQTKLHDINGIPHLILVASRDIKAGEELLYDYGDRSKASLEAHPWLKH